MDHNSDTSSAAPAHTVADAVRIACSSRTAIYAALAAGKLSAKKLGRKTIITDAALRAYIDGLPSYKTSVGVGK